VFGIEGFCPCVGEVSRNVREIVIDLILTGEKVHLVQVAHTLRQCRNGTSRDGQRACLHRLELKRDPSVADGRLGAKAESIFVNSQTRCGSESEGEFTR